MIESIPQKNIRNFCIIAHIDHGKSTLADRLLEITGAVDKRDMKQQLLDSMDLERERGITIKAQTVRINYTAKNGELYQLNLVDTPGHVDFSYEVSRSMKAAEGALLVVDASQGVEAQTIANSLIAIDSDLEIIPVLNKIDLPSADPERVKQEIEEIIGIDSSETVEVSAKTGKGVDLLLEKIIELIPPPTGDIDAPLKAIIFDSWFDSYLGVMSLVRVIDGKFSKDTKIKMFSTDRAYELSKLGAFMPKIKYLKELKAGEVGFISSNMKNVSEALIGDTVTNEKNPASEALGGFKPIKQMVFCGLYPVDNAKYDALKEALDKLNLNDSSFTYEKHTSEALGFGFRSGFLGLLHMEIIKERLEREFQLELISTAPSVVYNVVLTSGKNIEIDNPSELPNLSLVEHIEEPYLRLNIHTPMQYLGGLLKLCTEKRGTQVDMITYQNQRVQLIYDIPMAEVMFDFYDKLKSLSSGYASMDYDLIGYKKSSLVKLDVMINGKTVDALSIITHKDNSYYRARELVRKLRKVISRQMFEISIQAAVGSRIIAKERIQALRKNVTAKCYGGDITRKRKLLEKQKEGKKRMKRIGNVDIPQEAFLAVLTVDDK